MLPAKVDEAQVQIVPLVLREQHFEVRLCLLYCLALCQAPSQRQAVDVCVHWECGYPTACEAVHSWLCWLCAAKPVLQHMQQQLPVAMLMQEGHDPGKGQCKHVLLFLYWLVLYCHSIC